MAGFRIASSLTPDPTPKHKAVKKASYLDFIRSLPCVITGRDGVEAAHLSFAAPKYGHYGRGRGTKAGDRWALPLISEAHREQHKGNEELRWRMFKINPHVLALTLFGLWSDMGDDAEPFATAIIKALQTKEPTT
jgi:hypothetical protein